MKTNEFALLGQELDLTPYGPFLCGIVDGWPITLANNSFTLLRITVDKTRKASISRQFEAELKTWSGKLYSWIGDQLVLSAPLNRKKAKGTTADYIHFALEALSRAGLSPCGQCPYCGDGNCDHAACTPKGYRLAHYRCLQQQALTVKSKAEDNQQNGNYLPGILGAFLGMIVGSVPTFLTIAFMQMEYALLFALIPICAYFGYKLFGGRMNRTALVVSIVMAVLGVFLLNFEYIAYMVMHDYNATFGEMIRFMPELLRDGSVWLEIAANSLQEFLFSALGVLFAWRFISGTASGAVSNAEATLRLAKPYPVHTDNSHEDLS